MKNLAANSIRLCVLLMLGISCASTHAAYNANASGKVKWIKVYPDNDAIYFEITDNQPTHTQHHYFAIRGDAVVDQGRRDRLYSMLLAAKASGSTVEVGYDNTSNGSYVGAVEVYAISILEF